jgi:undecaprenyl-diphosphatase
VRETLQALLLAVVQGLTEFLPVSSSAHLILPAQLLGWPDQGLAFDVAVHLGSLLAVLWYFREDLWLLLQGGTRALLAAEMNREAQMLLWLAVATLPAGLAGLLLDDWVEANLRSVVVIAGATALFGILLGLADRRRGTATLSLRSAWLIGCAQMLALVPGTSRSGITITAALFLGLDRQGAARFSFLLSIPIIAAAAGFKGLQLLSSETAVNWGLLLGSAALSGLTAWLCIGWFLALVDRIGMLPFVLYRCALALVLFSIWW